MRVALAISAVIHAAVLLWLVLAPASRPFDPAYAKALLVDLVPPLHDQNAAQRQPPKPDSPSPDSPKPPDNPDSPKPPDKPEPAAADTKASPKKPEPAAADAKASPKKPKPAVADAKAPPKKPAAGGQDDAAEAAARLAWMLDAPANLPANLAAPPSENETSLAPGFIARFKAQVRKCFVPLADPPDTPDFATEIRIALRPNGTLAADPEMTFAPAIPNGRVLMERAKQAVRQCQPYSFLPADKYADWRIIDLIFSYDGPADEATANAVRQKIFSNR
jgi:hypothetical protein